MMTGQELANELATEAGEDYTDSVVANQFHEWIEEAFILVTSSARWLFQNIQTSVVTSVGVAEYTLPATFAEVSLVRNIMSNKTIGYNTVEDLSRLEIDFESNGTVVAWNYSGFDANTTALKISFFPPPSSVQTFTVHGFKRPDALVLSNPIPLPIELLQVIRLYVRSMYALSDNRLDVSAGLQQLYQNQLREFVGRYNQPRRQQSRLAVRNLPRNPQAGAASSD